MVASTKGKKGKPKPGDVIIALPVKLKGKSTSPKKISISCAIGREYITLAKADSYLVFRRVTAKLEVGTVAAAQAGNQKKLPGLGEVDHSVTAVIQTSRLSVGDDDYTLTLNFPLKELGSESKLEGFAGRDGMLHITGVDELTAEEADEDEEALHEKEDAEEAAKDD